MKKMYFALSVAILFAFGVSAQTKEEATTHKGFVIASAGPSFPIGPYGSTDLNHSDAGLAKTGLGLELQMGYLLNRNVGLTASAIYAKHSIDDKVLNGSNASVDHWQYWGVLGGLLVSAPVARDVSFDFRATTGVARVNSPKITYNNTTLFPEDWTTTVPVKFDGNFRFLSGRQVQILAGVNYVHMDPKFKIPTTGGESRPRQKINVLGVNAGIGLGF